MARSFFSTWSACMTGVCLKDKPLCVLHPILYDWCGDKFIVFSVLDRNGRLNFNRWLPPSLFETWMGVVDETFSYSFENQNDKVSWKWGSKRVCLLNRCMITWHCAQGVLNSLIFWRLTFPIKSNFHLVGRKWGCADQRYHGQEEVVRWPYLCLLWSTWNSWPPPFSLACGKMCLGNDWFMFWGI